MIDVLNTATGRFAYITKTPKTDRYSVSLGETYHEGIRELVPWVRILEVMSTPPTRGKYLSLDEAYRCTSLWVGNS